MIINLKTAKALGITVLLALSGRADEVIKWLNNLLQCMSLLLALFGHGATPDLIPLSGV